MRLTGTVNRIDVEQRRAGVEFVGTNQYGRHVEGEVELELPGVHAW
jgi:hypothetical protein